MSGVIGSMTGNVLNSDKSGWGKAKRVLANSIGVSEDGRGLNPSGQLDPLELNWFETPGEKAERAAFNNPPPTPEPVKEMPVPGDAASQAAAKRKQQAMASRGGRQSTIITGSRLGD